MKLSDLSKYNQIAIQCHDNPDPDTIGSGFGLYVYFRSMRIPVKLFYSGANKISKRNLLLMTEELSIPLEYIPVQDAEAMKIDGLLITVDCQYDSGNVTKINAENVAIIDHHPLEEHAVSAERIQPELGACTTLVWQMLKEENFPITENKRLCTALYYGLYTDTNQFSELFNSDDLDMRDALVIDKKIIRQLRGTNLSLEELEIAGMAMKDYYYSFRHRYAVIRTKPCDSNVLGLIADFLMQVGEIDIAVVFNQFDDGFKLSVRSCTASVKANELTEYLTMNIGTGGGHYEKAGGFISKSYYQQKYPSTTPEEFFRICLSEYLESFDMIYAASYEFSKGKEIKRYKRKQQSVLVTRPDSFMEPGEKVSFRWGSLNQEMEITRDEYWILERGGYIHRMAAEDFDSCFEKSCEELPEDYPKDFGWPILKEWHRGNVTSLAGYCSMYKPKDDFRVEAMQLTRSIKLFPTLEENFYTTGYPGDYLVVGLNNKKIKMIEAGKWFMNNYEPDEE